MNMQTKYTQSEYQRVKCIKDNRIYVFNINNHPDYYSEDFALIRCYRVEKDHSVDFSKEFQIYGKDLISMYEDEF
jgi:hypothetical protein